MKNTLCCVVQNRLGALDRVLGALTYRGMLPEQMVTTVDTCNDSIQIVVTFECDEEKTVEKLVKFLNKQVYVLDIKRVFMGRQEQEASMTAPSNVATLYPQTRRLSNVNNA
jgi:acetolactate synthase small subunit